MIKNLIYNFYIFFHDLIFLFKSLSNKKNFVLLFPRLFCLIFKRVLIFDKINFCFFLQKIRNNYDLLTVYEIFQEEFYNLNNFKQVEKITDYYNQIIQNNKKPLIIDCGSNIGSSSNYFSRIFHNSFVVSIEPEVSNFKMIKKNFNSMNSVLINKAISCDDKNYFLNILDDSRAHFINDYAGDIKDNYLEKKVEIKSITVEDILIEYKNNYTPFLIKIDIEGFEKNLFSKNFEWMKNFLIIIIEIHDWMIPGKSISSNFIKALEKISNDENNKRDLIISGENLISIRLNKNNS
jgi:FkbM family methyltransferase